MPLIEIKNHKTGSVLYKGHFHSAKDCLEQAVLDGVTLDEADLRYANLAHAALDEIVLRGALMDHCNLAGANLSEAQLNGTSFTGATLHGACFCFSVLDRCNFENALWGGTDIAGCSLQQSRFAALSAFSLNFIDTSRIKDCTYRATAGTSCTFSRSPLIIKGLALPVIFMDRHLKIGHMVKTYGEWHSLTNDNTPANRPDSGYIYNFFKQHQDLLRGLCERQGLQSLPQESSKKTA